MLKERVKGAFVKALKNSRLWSGLAAAFSFLLVVIIFGSTIANANAAAVNNALHISDTVTVPAEGNGNVDAVYYKTSVGDGTFSRKNLDELFSLTISQNVKEMEEGAALLYNENAALPLKNQKRISVFGHAAAYPAYQANSAGVKVEESHPYTVDFKTALKGEGFVYNEALWSALDACSLHRSVQGSGTGAEENISFYEGLRSTYESDYKDAAIVMFARQGGEDYDMLMEEDDDEGGSLEKISSLALHKNERDLLKLVREDFDKVIVLLNSPYQLEVEEMKNYCDAILYIGYPGHQGFIGVAEILSGSVNPSGRLTDTYAVNSLSAPSTVNSGTNTPFYDNYRDIRTKNTQNERGDKLSVQVEGIYIGYRYYETRYADCVYGGRGADSASGASSGAAAWNYRDEVSYTFGRGLSYTSFEQEIVGFTENVDSVEFEVRVKNTGSTAGKSVVQVYAQTPYGNYEISNKIEKSAIQIVGFAKTGLIEPDKEQTLTVTVDKYLLASYDSSVAEGYILSKGDYYFSIGDDAHDALNNVLAAQGYSIADGMTSSGDGSAAKVRKFTLTDLDTESYKYGENGYRVTNRFEDRDLNYWKEGAAVYITRSNWKDSYPKARTTVAATEKMIDVLSNEWYMTEDKTSPYYSWSDDAREFNANVNFQALENNFKALDAAEGLEIYIPEMRGVSLEDDKWREFVYQIAADDIIFGTCESNLSPAVGAISPAFNVGDGIDSIGGSIAIYKNSGTIYPADSDDTVNYRIATLRYCSNSIQAGTFNVDIYEGRGKCIGEEGLWSRTMINYNLGLDLHRTPFGGRNFEYMSEDSIMTYLASIPQTLATEKTGSHAAPKHFCGNDQETYRDGVSCFTTEQAFRENALRAFEGALRVANAGGLMQSFERTGMIFTSYDYALNTIVLRNEWNWQGSIDTDACPVTGTAKSFKDKGYRNHALEGFAAGTTQWCFDAVGGHAYFALKQARETSDAYILDKLIDSTVRWEYLIANSNAINGIAVGDKIVRITVWWQSALIVAQVIVGALTVIAIALTVCGFVLKFRNKKGER